MLVRKSCASILLRPSLQIRSERAMAYPRLPQIRSIPFAKHGYLESCVAPSRSGPGHPEYHWRPAVRDKERLANDWPGTRTSPRDRSFRIVQSTPTLVWKDIADQPTASGWQRLFAG